MVQIQPYFLLQFGRHKNLDISIGRWKDVQKLSFWLFHSTSFVYVSAQLVVATAAATLFIHGTIAHPTLGLCSVLRGIRPDKHLRHLL